MQPADGKQYATIAGALVAPTSRGNVTIFSADTDDLPIVNPNWLATEADQQVAVTMYKRIRDMFHSTAMAPLVLGEEYFPGMQVQSDSDILNIVRDTMMTVFHAAGTCRMGVPGDRMAVLDSRARVFGVQGLRVVDASSMPILVPGHPQSAVCKCRVIIQLSRADSHRYACRKDCGRYHSSSCYKCFTGLVLSMMAGYDVIGLFDIIYFSGRRHHRIGCWVYELSSGLIAWIGLCQRTQIRSSSPAHRKSLGRGMQMQSARSS